MFVMAVCRCVIAGYLKKTVKNVTIVQTTQMYDTSMISAGALRLSRGRDASRGVYSHSGSPIYSEL